MQAQGLIKPSYPGTISSNNSSSIDSSNGLTSNSAQSILFDVREGEISFTFGAPDESLLKLGIPILQQALLERCSEDKDCFTLLQYGPIAGDFQFIDNLSKFLTTEYNDRVERHQLIATTGASHGLSLACTLLMKPNDICFIEDPTYFLAENLIVEHHLQVKGVKSDAHGMDMDDLEAKIKASCTMKDPTQGFSAMIYIVPTFSNPRGTSLPAERRKKLVELAHKYNVLVLCDDVYELLCHTSAQPPIPRVFAFEREYLQQVNNNNNQNTNNDTTELRGCVVSNGTFSKIFGPGVRLGWWEAQDNIMKKLHDSGFMASGGGAQHCMSGIIAQALKNGGIKTMLESLRSAYGTRMTKVCSQLKALIPSSIGDFIIPEGGIFIWYEFKDPEVKSEDLLVIGRNSKFEYKVGFQPGNRFSTSQSYKNCVRLGVAFHTEEELEEGVRRFARLVEAEI